MDSQNMDDLVDRIKEEREKRERLERAFGHKTIPVLEFILDTEPDAEHVWDALRTFVDLYNQDRYGEVGALSVNQLQLKVATRCVAVTT